MATLLESRPQQHARYEEEDFIVLHDVPVWKEHVNRDGIHFGPRELRQVCDNCNERIEDTGDFSPVVLNHTQEDGSSDPEVVGFAGPFRVGTLGNTKPKAAIFATLRIYHKDADRLRKFPRLSVEYWANEDEPTNGYFDPISLLGAKTPELDLGIHYSRKAGDGMRVLRYSRVTRFEATSPGGSNSFPPAGLGDDDDNKKVAKDDPEDEVVDEEPEKYEHEDEPEEVPQGALSEGDIQQLVAALTPLIDEAVDARIAMMKEPAEDSLGQPGDDEEEEEEDLEDMEDLDAIGDEESAEYDETELNPDDEDDDMADEKTPPVDELDDKKKAVKYAKERDEIKVKYEKEVKARRAAETELTDLKSRVDSIESTGRKAVRYQKLSSLQSEGYVLDPDEEIIEVESFADDQFDKHCDRIVAKYQRVPLGQIPIPPSEKYDGNRKGKAEKYERACEKAKENCLSAAEKGESLDYGRELKRLLEETAA